MHFDRLDESYAMVKSNLHFDKITLTGLIGLAYPSDRYAQSCNSGRQQWTLIMLMLGELLVDQTNPFLVRQILTFSHSNNIMNSGCSFFEQCCSLARTNLFYLNIFLFMHLNILGFSGVVLPVVVNVSVDSDAHMMTSLVSRICQHNFRKCS